MGDTIHFSPEAKGWWDETFSIRLGHVVTALDNLEMVPLILQSGSEAQEAQKPEITASPLMVQAVETMSVAAAAPEAAITTDHKAGENAPKDAAATLLEEAYEILKQSGQQSVDEGLAKLRRQEADQNNRRLVDAP